MHFQNIFLIPSSSNALGDMKLINFQVIWKSSNKSLSRLGENPISSIGWYILAKIGNFVKMGHWAAHQYLREASSKRKRFESQNFWKPKPPTAYCGAFLFLMNALVLAFGSLYCSLVEEYIALLFGLVSRNFSSLNQILWTMRTEVSQRES